MPRTVTFEGKPYSFPDDATDEEISAALGIATAPPSMGEVIAAIPGTAKRQLASTVAGLDLAIADVANNEEWRRRALGAKREIALETQAETPKNMGILQEGVLAGGASALTQVPIMAAAALSAAPAAVATTAMGVVTGLQRYGDIRAAGFGPARAALHGAVEGLIEKYTEYLPLKFLERGGPLWTEVKGFFLREGLGEQLATLGQDISAKLSDQPDMTLGDYARDALVTAVATPVGGALQLGAGLGINTLARQVAASAATPDAPAPAPSPAGTPPTPTPPPLAATGEPVTIPEPSPAPATPIEPSAVGPVASPPAAGVAPATVVVEQPVPEPHTLVRVYLTTENESFAEATLDPVEAAAIRQPVQFIDVTPEQLTTLQDLVPDSARNVYDGTSRFPLKKGPELVWKTAGEPVVAVPGVAADVDITEQMAGRGATVPGRSEPLPIDIESSAATGISFPDDVTKTLWQYGAALARLEITTRPADSKKLDAMREKAKEVSGIKDDVEVADTASRYVLGVSIMGLTKAKKGVFNAPLLQNALKAQEQHQAHVTNELAAQIKPGQVALSRDLPATSWLKQMQRYLQAWVATFSPNMKIVVLGEQSDIDGTRARTWYYGGVHYVYVPKEVQSPTQRALALYVLAHEFGHMIVNEHLNDPRNTAYKDALIKEYADFVARIGGTSAEEFVRAGRSPIDILGRDFQPGQTSGQYVAALGPNAITFDEWLADQFVRYVHTNQTFLKVPGEKGFWKSLMDKLQTFFDTVVRKFEPTETFKNWLETLRLQDSSQAPTVASVVRRQDEPRRVAAKPGVNFGRLTTLLGSKLYGNPTDLPAVSVKEMFQNAFDAIKTELEHGRLAHGEITLILDPEKRTISMQDNGSGMSPEILATAFLQIAGTHKGTSRASGGLGIAKGLFLYGNEKIAVVTVHNGTRSTLETSGVELMAAADGQGEPVKIHVEKAENAAPEDNQNGTYVQVTIPKSFDDPTTGKTEEIKFDRWLTLPVLEFSPLFEKVTVRKVTHSPYGGVDDDILPIGDNFPHQNYGHFAKVKFQWGTADVYVTKKELEGYVGTNLHVLSNGLWQFSDSLPEDPFNPFGGNVPRYLYINVTPSVRADQPGYPFDLNRQKFSMQAEGDLRAVYAYLSLTYKKQQTAQMAAGYGTIAYVDANGLVSDAQNLTPVMSKSQAATLFQVTENDEVEVKDGKLYVNNREVPVLTKEDMKSAEEYLKEFKIPQDRVDPTRVMVHNNIELYPPESGKKAPLTVGMPMTPQPLPVVMRRKYGVEFDKFLHDFGQVFKHVIDTMVEKKGYEKLSKLANGVSFDKTYHGVHATIPFHTVFINPASYRKWATPRAQALAMWLTMVHEISHLNQMNHNATFISELQDNITTLTYSGASVTQQNMLEAVLTKHWAMVQDLQEVFDYEGAKPRGKNLPDVARYDRSAGRSFDVAGTGEGAVGHGGLYEAVEKFSANGESVDDAPGVSVQDFVVIERKQRAPERVLGSGPEFEYTTRVLARLPNKPTIKKVTIYGELGRQEIRKQERELIGQVLKTFPGESVDAALFKEAVLKRIQPLRLQTTKTYAAYGMSGLGYGGQRGGYEDSFFNAETHLWIDPTSEATSPHFPEGVGYWAHTRGFGNENVWYVIEVQSDAEQHGGMDEREERLIAEEEVKDLQQQLDVLGRLRLAVSSRSLNALRQVRSVNPYALNLAPRSVHDAVDEYQSALERGDARAARNGHSVASAELDSEFTRTQVRLQDLQASLAAPSVNEALPKNWWELVLRHEITLAAQEGWQQLRLATADTVARVENWPRFPGPDAEEVGFAALGNLRTRPGDFLETGGRRYYITEVTETPSGASVRAVPEEQLTRLGSNQGIYNRYANDIPKFLKREYPGTKEVTDDLGNTWWEVPLNVGLADLPITYYNTAAATKEAGTRIAALSGVPELPDSFTRFQSFLQSVLQLNQISKLLPQVQGLQAYRAAMRSLHTLKAKLFEGPNDRIHEWHKLGRKQASLVEQALRDEQLQGEHWTELRQTEVDDGSGGKKTVWVHIPSASFERTVEGRGMTQEARNLFIGIKNDYLSTLTAMEEVVRMHTEKFFADNPLVLATRMAEIDEEFRDLRNKPYLPDMRFGRYFVEVRAGRDEVVDGREIKRGELVYYEKFESKRNRDARLRELKRDVESAHIVSGGYDSEFVSSMRGVPQSVMDAVVGALDSNEATKLSDEQRQSLDAVAFDQTAAGRFAKYLKTPAKHVAGSSKDMRRAYAAYHWRTANAIAKLRYSNELNAATGSVRADARSIRRMGGTDDPYAKLHEYLQKNLAYVMQPQHEYEQLRSLVSLWYLWGSPKTAIMNLMSVPVLSYPYLWARFGATQSMASMLTAMKDAAQYWRDPTKLSPDKRRVLEQLKADGVTDQSFASMLASVSEGGVAFERIIPQFESFGPATDIARRTAWKITAMGMAPFRVVEQFNRQVTGLAAYDLMAGKIKKTLSQGDRQAYDFARDAVEYTQNEYSAWNRPPISMGKQSIFLLFFSFVQNMSFMMFGGDKSWWRAMMVLAALAGVQGLPGAENLIDMMNWAYRKLTGQFIDLKVEARAVAHEVGLNPEWVMHGISHNWLGLGWDTSSSVGIGRIIPGTDSIFGIGRFEDRFLHGAAEVGGPVGSLMLSFLQAMADDNPNMLLRWDRALPPVIRNIEKTAIALTNDEWVNSRGRPLATEPTTTELLGQALGFAPTRRTSRQEELRTVKDIAEFYSERRTNLMEQYWSARHARDTGMMADVRLAIKDYNDKVPDPKLRISASDISQSMQTRDRMEQETANFRSPQKRYRDVYRYIGELY